MFTNLIPYSNETLYSIILSDFAQKHFLKNFIKRIPSRNWRYTADSIKEDLSRIAVSASDIQKTSQVKELWHKDDYWIFKYEFNIAGSKVSRKASGNRIVALLDAGKRTITIILIYKKSYLPKNMGETAYIESCIKREFAEFWEMCR